MLISQTYPNTYANTAMQCEDYANLQSLASTLLISLTTSTVQFYYFCFQLFHSGLNVLHLFISDFLISYFAISALRFTAVSFCLSSQTENLNRRI